MSDQAMVATEGATPAVQKAVPALCFAALALLAIYRALTHTPWFDELHAYLIARSSSGLVDLYRNLRNEGHPGLWHLVVQIAALAVPRPEVLALLQAAVATGILALIWFVSPFTLIERALLSAGYFISLEYGVLSRGYGLGALLLFLFAHLRRSAWSWVILGLTANISANFFLTAGLLACVQFLSGDRRPAPIGAFLLLVALAVLTAWPGADTVPSMPVAPSSVVGLLRSSAWLSTALLPVTFSHPSGGFWNVALYDIGLLPLAAAGLAVPVLGVLALRGSSLYRAAFVALWACLLIMGAVVYPLFTRHVGALFLLLVVGQWILREDGAARDTWVFRGWVGLNAAIGLWALVLSAAVPFTGGVAAAAWLGTHNAQGLPVAAYPVRLTAYVPAYLDWPPYNVLADRSEVFTRFNFPSEQPLEPDLLAARLAAVSADRGAYLLTQPGLRDAIGGRLYVGPETIAALAARGVRLHLVAEFPGNPFPAAVYLVSTAP